MFTFRPERNLNGYSYLVGEWSPHTLAMTRMLANCQLGIIATIMLMVFTGDEKAIRSMVKILILVTLGAFRAISAGVQDGVINPPWKTEYAAVMSLPPFLLLSCFSFLF